VPKFHFFTSAGAGVKYLNPITFLASAQAAAQEKRKMVEKKYLRSLSVRVIAFFVRRKSLCRNVGHTHFPAFLISAR
jgi:hypothetical protein